MSLLSSDVDLPLMNVIVLTPTIIILHCVWSGASQVALVDSLPVAGDTGLIPGWGRSLGGGHGNPLQCSCLENPIIRGAWWATVHRVTQSGMWLKRLSMQHVGGVMEEEARIPEAVFDVNKDKHLASSRVLFLTVPLKSYFCWQWDNILNSI